MKKYIFLCCLIGTFLLQGCGEGEIVEYSYREYGLNQPVKSVRMTEYDASSKFGEVVKGECRRVDVHDFNEDGFVAVSTRHDRYGDMRSVYKYRYNEGGKSLGWSYYDSDGAEVRRGDLEYEGGNLSKVTVRSGHTGNVDFMTKYEYNEGVLEATRRYDRDGELVHVRKYSKHDKTGCAWVEYDESGNEDSRGEEQLDKNGRIVKSTEGCRSFEVVWNEKGLPEVVKNGTWDCESLSRDGFRYAYSDNDRTYYYEYEYDKKGNWIKVTEYLGEFKKPIHVVEREITY